MAHQTLNFVLEGQCNYPLVRGKVYEGVVAERIRAPNSSLGASVKQSVSLNPGRDTCVPEQDT